MEEREIIRKAYVSPLILAVYNRELYFGEYY